MPNYRFVDSIVKGDIFWGLHWSNYLWSICIYKRNFKIIGSQYVLPCCTGHREKNSHNFNKELLNLFFVVATLINKWACLIMKRLKICNFLHKMTHPSVPCNFDKKNLIFLRLFWQYNQNVLYCTVLYCRVLKIKSKIPISCRQWI